MIYVNLVLLAFVLIVLSQLVSLPFLNRNGTGSLLWTFGAVLALAFAAVCWIGWNACLSSVARMSGPGPGGGGELFMILFSLVPAVILSIPSVLLSPFVILTYPGFRCAPQANYRIDG